ncbi:hypothetical protein [Melioribacter sp. OK-6-Me]|uniref:hypothetical protein n=1 Tax=unclassified Melioribacter TaxID=2627329 RepID=UPI003ED99A1F
MKGIISIFITIIICACASIGSYYTYGVDTIEDEFDGYKIIRMHGNYLPDNAIIPTSSLLFNPQIFIDRDGNKKYQFYAEYTDKDWLFIREGASLILLIDGDRVELNGYGSNNHREVVEGYTGPVIKEIAIYEASKELFEKISNAKVVKLKIRGAARSIERELSSKHINNIMMFVRDYVK